MMNIDLMMMMMVAAEVMVNNDVNGYHYASYGNDHVHDLDHDHDHDLFHGHDLLNVDVVVYIV